MSDGLAVGQDASNVLSYMKMMFDEAKKNGIRSAGATSASSAATSSSSKA